MARHIYIGNNVAVAYAAGGTLANGAIDIQKQSLSGPTSLVATDTITSAPQIRFVQGDGSRDIVSPWIYGRDIINYDGQSYVAPTAHSHTVTYAGTSTAAGQVDIKICRTDKPGFDCFSFSTTIPSGTANTAVDALVKTEYDAATKPDWLATTCTAPGTTNVFSSLLPGGVASSGKVWSEIPATFVVSCTDSPAGITTTWTTDSAPTTSSDAGAGDGYFVRDLEEYWNWGRQYGVYDRAGIAKNPTRTAVVTNNYDVYSISCTKDGSTQSQVHGVDNIIDIGIAMIAGGAQGPVFEVQHKVWINSCGFAAFSL